MGRSLLNVSRLVVAIGGLGAALIFLVLYGISATMSSVSTGFRVEAIAWLLPLLIVLGYGALVVFALRGYRLPAVIVAVTAWPLAVIPWIWLRNVTENPSAGLGPPVLAIVFFGLYALSATNLAAHSLLVHSRSSLPEETQSSSG